MQMISFVCDLACELDLYQTRCCLVSAMLHEKARHEAGPYGACDRGVSCGAGICFSEFCERGGVSGHLYQMRRGLVSAMLHDEARREAGPYGRICRFARLIGVFRRRLGLSPWI